MLKLCAKLSHYVLNVWGAIFRDLPLMRYQQEGVRVLRIIIDWIVAFLLVYRQSLIWSDVKYRG
jgi:hypothetical protein